MNGPIVGIGAAAVLLLSACSGGGAEQPVAVPAPATTAGTTTTPLPAVTSTTATPAGPSVAQFASVAAQRKASLEKLSQDLEDCVAPASEAASVACALIIQRAPVEGSVTAKQLRALGTPPAEISSIVKQTVTWADQLAAVDVHECTLQSYKNWLNECFAPSANSDFATKQALKVMAGWKPYGG